MLPAQLNDAVIALLQQEGKVFLGWEYGIPVASAPGYTPGQLYRVIDYDERSGVLQLKPEGKAASEAHRMTFDKYSSMFTAMGVKRIEIISPYKQITLATGYTQPISPGYRDRRPAYSPPPPAAPSSPPRWYEPPPIEPPKPVRFTEPHTFDIRQAVFDDGTISFTLKVKSMFQNVEVTINNPSVKKYFDAVKNYIYKLFGSKKTSCLVTFEVRDRKCVAVEVGDCVLSSMDETILQHIHDGWIKQVVLSAERDEIVSLDELVEQVRDETLNPETVFNHIVQEEKTKHYHHLRFLSARQAIDLQKLSLTGKPISFVFLTRENGALFLIWETYLSEEATYIWKLAKPEQVLEKYALILEMRKSKRMIYRRKKEEGFYYIEHDYQQAMNGFHKWKEEIENIFKTA
ncbi:MAG: hypothetical protein IM598_10560 [Chitinophagaceae bacterium]|nr:hypothetical protein [Chitinophagaceae bacterium]MCA6460371.1 hypothetical protein [Chitinophagaceae bacterium]MCA6465258.1 hypothetical protein [Chitinophagaceae bacterium]